MKTYTAFFLQQAEPFQIPTWLGVFSHLDFAYQAAMNHELRYNWDNGSGYYSIMEMEVDKPKTAKRVCRVPAEDNTNIED